MREDCAALGVTTPVPLRVRVALRRRTLYQDVQAVLVFIGLWLCTGLAIAWPRISHNLDWWLKLLAVLVSGVIAAVPSWLVFRETLIGKFPVLASLLLARRYALVFDCAHAIYACAAARRSGEGQPAGVKEVSRRLSAVRKAVVAAHRSRGSVPRLSGRRKQLKEHQLKVASALQVLEGKLDQDPSRALPEIAEALLTIADRYCAGRIGALLDEHHLVGTPRRRNWDALRYLVALVLAAGGITVLAVTESIPESAEPYIFVIVVVAAFVVAWGREVRRALEVLGIVSGQA